MKNTVESDDIRMPFKFKEYLFLSLDALSFIELHNVRLVQHLNCAYLLCGFRLCEKHRPICPLSNFLIQIIVIYLSLGLLLE